MDRAAYESEICHRLPQVERVPFKSVSATGWQPAVAGCHENVNTWVRLNPGYSAVRGWVTNGSFGFAISLTAHSVVRAPDGAMFDITPLTDEAQRGEAIRRGMRFVEHLGTDQEFFALVQQYHSMCCSQPFDPDSWPGD